MNIYILECSAVNKSNSSPKISAVQVSISKDAHFYHFPFFLHCYCCAEENQKSAASISAAGNSSG